MKWLKLFIGCHSLLKLGLWFLFYQVHNVVTVFSIVYCCLPSAGALLSLFALSFFIIRSRAPSVSLSLRLRLFCIHFPPLVLQPLSPAPDQPNLCTSDKSDDDDDDECLLFFTSCPPTTSLSSLPVFIQCFPHTCSVKCATHTHTHTMHAHMSFLSFFLPDRRTHLPHVTQTHYSTQHRCSCFWTGLQDARSKNTVIDKLS